MSDSKGEGEGKGKGKGKGPPPAKGKGDSSDKGGPDIKETKEMARFTNKLLNQAFDTVTAKKYRQFIGINFPAIKTKVESLLCENANDIEDINSKKRILEDILDKIISLNGKLNIIEYFRYNEIADSSPFVKLIMGELNEKEATKFREQKLKTIEGEIKERLVQIKKDVVEQIEENKKEYRIELGKINAEIISKAPTDKPDEISIKFVDVIQSDFLFKEHYLFTELVDSDKKKQEIKGQEIEEQEIKELQSIISKSTILKDSPKIMKVNNKIVGDKRERNYEGVYGDKRKELIGVPEFNKHEGSFDLKANNAKPLGYINTMLQGSDRMDAFINDYDTDILPEYIKNDVILRDIFNQAAVEAKKIKDEFKQKKSVMPTVESDPEDFVEADPEKRASDTDKKHYQELLELKQKLATNVRIILAKYEDFFEYNQKYLDAFVDSIKNFGVDVEGHKAAEGVKENRENEVLPSIYDFVGTVGLLLTSRDYRASIENFLLRNSVSKILDFYKSIEADENINLYLNLNAVRQVFEKDPRSDEDNRTIVEHFLEQTYMKKISNDVFMGISGMVPDMLNPNAFSDIDFCFAQNKFLTEPDLKGQLLIKHKYLKSRFACKTVPTEESQSALKSMLLKYVAKKTGYMRDYNKPWQLEPDYIDKVKYKNIVSVNYGLTLNSDTKYKELLKELRIAINVLQRRIKNRPFDIGAKGFLAIITMLVKEDASEFEKIEQLFPGITKISIENKTKFADEAKKIMEFVEEIDKMDLFEVSEKLKDIERKIGENKEISVESIKYKLLKNIMELLTQEEKSVLQLREDFEENKEKIESELHEDKYLAQKKESFINKIKREKQEVESAYRVTINEPCIKDLLDGTLLYKRVSEILENKESSEIFKEDKEIAHLPKKELDDIQGKRVELYKSFVEYCPAISEIKILESFLSEKQGTDLTEEEIKSHKILISEKKVTERLERGEKKFVSKLIADGEASKRVTKVKGKFESDEDYKTRENDIEIDFDKLLEKMKDKHDQLKFAVHELEEQLFKCSYDQIYKVGNVEAKGIQSTRNIPKFLSERFMGGEDILLLDDIKEIKKIRGVVVAYKQIAATLKKDIVFLEMKVNKLSRHAKPLEYVKIKKDILEVYNAGKKEGLGIDDIKKHMFYYIEHIQLEKIFKNKTINYPEGISFTDYSLLIINLLPTGMEMSSQEAGIVSLASSSEGRGLQEPSEQDDSGVVGVRGQVASAQDPEDPQGSALSDKASYSKRTGKQVEPSKDSEGAGRSEPEKSLPQPQISGVGQGSYAVKGKRGDQGVGIQESEGSAGDGQSLGSGSRTEDRMGDQGGVDPGLETGGDKVVNAQDAPTPNTSRSGSKSNPSDGSSSGADSPEATSKQKPEPGIPGSDHTARQKSINPTQDQNEKAKPEHEPEHVGKKAEPGTGANGSSLQDRVGALDQEHQSIQAHSQGQGPAINIEKSLWKNTNVLQRIKKVAQKEGKERKPEVDLEEKNIGEKWQNVSKKIEEKLGRLHENDDLNRKSRYEESNSQSNKDVKKSLYENQNKARYTSSSKLNGQLLIKDSSNSDAEVLTVTKSQDAITTELTGFRSNDDESVIERQMLLALEMVREQSLETGAKRVTITNCEELPKLAIKLYQVAKVFGLDPRLPEDTKKKIMGKEKYEESELDKILNAKIYDENQAPQIKPSGGGPRK